MTETIFIGNLPKETSEQDVRAMFSSYGEIHSVKIIRSRKTGTSRGICFVEMAREGAERVIQAFDGKGFEGRTLHVRFVQEEDGKDTSSF